MSTEVAAGTRGPETEPSAESAQPTETSQAAAARAGASGRPAAPRLSLRPSVTPKAEDGAPTSHARPSGRIIAAGDEDASTTAASEALDAGEMPDEQEESQNEAEEDELQGDVDDEDELDDEDDDELEDDDDDEDSDAGDRVTTDFHATHPELATTLPSPGSEDEGPSSPRLAVRIEEAAHESLPLRSDAQMSFPPVVEDLDEAVASSEFPAGVRKRQRSSRVWVGALLGIAAIGVLAVGGRAWMKSQDADAAAGNSDAQAAAAAANAGDSTGNRAGDRAGDSAGDRAGTPDKAAGKSATADTAGDDPAAKVGEADTEDATATDGDDAADASEAVEGGPDSSASYKEVSKGTLTRLTRGKVKEAEVWARRLVEMRPDDAFGYRCLGAALQDSGRVADARSTYNDCVRLAKKGDVGECAALGGR